MTDREHHREQDHEIPPVAPRPLDAVELRRQAEEKARRWKYPEGETLSPIEAQQAVHELLVHQIELEMQNEELRRAHAEMAAARERYFDLYDFAPVGYCTLSEKGLIVEANLTAASLLGVTRGTLLRQPLTRFIFSEDQDVWYLYCRRLLEVGVPRTCELRLAKPDGVPLWVRVEGTVGMNKASGVSEYRIALSDITERKVAEAALQRNWETLNDANLRLKSQLAVIEALEQDLREQSIHDPLTGLYNRRFLEESFKRELAIAERDTKPVAVVMGDIDHFKNVNDQYGHQTGDVVLQELGTLFSSRTRRGDIVCRYGGEEFLIVLYDASASLGLRVAEEWRQAFQDINFNHGENTFRVTISFGVSAYPEHGQSAEELIRSADRALYAAKAAGRNRSVVWEAEPAG